MILIIVLVVLSLLLGLTAFVQLLYAEALRLRPREPRSLEFFRETLEDRLRYEPEQGTLAFSLLKLATVILLTTTAVGVNLSFGAPPWRALLEGLALSGLLMLGFAYLLPHVLYRRTQGRWLLPLVPLLRVLAFLTRPAAWVLGFMESVASLGGSQEKKEENGSAAEEIEALILVGTEEGIIEEQDRRLIQSVVEFGDKRVREVMTPRPNVVAIEAGKPLEDLRQLVINEQFSRIPIYEQTIDNIIGFVHVRDMFELNEKERATRDLRALMRPIVCVPETKPVHELLREMQRMGSHMAVVIDEYGNTAGLVTMEDLVEEILGEIRDEHEPSHDVTRDETGGIIVSGSFDLDHLHELLDFRPEEETESTTVGGLVTEWLGYVPHPGEAVERDGIRLEVTAGNEFHVEQVRISKSEKTSHA